MINKEVLKQMVIDNGVDDVIKMVKQIKFELTPSKTEVTLNGLTYLIVDFGIIYHSDTLDEEHQLYGVKDTLKDMVKYIPNSRIPTLEELREIHKQGALPIINSELIPLDNKLVQKYVEFRNGCTESRIRELLADHESISYWADSYNNNDNSFGDMYITNIESHGINPNDRPDIFEYGYAQASTCLGHGFLIVLKTP